MAWATNYDPAIQVVPGSDQERMRGIMKEQGQVSTARVEEQPRVKPRKSRRPKDLRIYKSWCKKCGICAAFCPKGALEMTTDGPEWSHPEACIGCGMCELRCPDFAIEVIPREEDSGGEKK